MNTSMRPTIHLCGLLTVAFLVSACSDRQAAKVGDAAPPMDQPAPPSPGDQLIEHLTQLGAVKGDRGLSVRMSSATFEPGQTRFEPSDTTRIGRIAEILKGNPQVHVVVRAFTDSRGGTARNQSLSQQRADAVVQALKDRGADVMQMQAEGMGEKQPIASNDTAEGRAQNRRIDIEFSDVEGKFAADEELVTAN